MVRAWRKAIRKLNEMFPDAVCFEAEFDQEWAERRLYSTIATTVVIDMPSSEFRDRMHKFFEWLRNLHRRLFLDMALMRSPYRDMALVKEIEEIEERKGR